MTVEREKKADFLTDEQKDRIRELINDDLDLQDLIAWQKSCKSLAPPHYDEITRKTWFEENRFRIPTARVIIEFIDEWTKALNTSDEFSTVKLAVLRGEIVEVIREAQERRSITTSKLNVVKLAALRTLVKWAETPTKLDEGPYEGKRQVPSGGSRSKKRRHGRKSAKGEYQSPQITLVKQIGLIGEDTILLTIGIVNNNLHPFQRVSLELSFDSKLSFLSAEDFLWSPGQNTINIGFLEASLDAEPLEFDIQVRLRINRPGKKFKISGIVHFDNTERGVRSVEELPTEMIEI